jgi:hypothetical protein
MEKGRESATSPAAYPTLDIRSKTRPVRWRKFFIPCLPT